MNAERKGRVLVTGASGFVGGALVKYLAQNRKFEVTAAMRRLTDDCSASMRCCRVGELNAQTDWCEALADCNVVVHCAARAHVMKETAVDPMSVFRQVNVEGTLNLARQAAEAGVRRFVFISSVKVNGERTLPGQLFTADDTPAPEDPYALSKYEAEQGLLALAKESWMDVVIIRPPLLYGPGVKANFASMIKWVSKGVPLPLGAVHNQRSLLALDNLLSFIEYCADVAKTPQAANQVFLISDGEDVSTTELLRKVAKAFGKKARLIPVPVAMMTLAAKWMGKGAVANRLFSSLQVDSSKARQLLGWYPVVTMDEQLAKTARAFSDQSDG